jgi:hypothetical protein
VSKKTRTRRGPSAASARPQAAPGSSALEATGARLLSRLWTALSAGEPLRAEIETATFMALPYATGHTDPEVAETFISKALVDGATAQGTPDGAALLRLLMSLGTPGIRSDAREALSQLTARGIYPPGWVTGIGKAAPGRAWRRYDIFGDGEIIAVTFRYDDDDEHALAVQVDLTAFPIATVVAVTTDASVVNDAVNHQDDPYARLEPISMAEARRRLLEPLDRFDYADRDRDMFTETTIFLPIARSRVRRLPSGDAGLTEFTAADRAAAVDEFMKSAQAAEAVSADEDSTRFWAEVLTGYSSRVPGEPPGHVGPRKLVQILLAHVPEVFTLTPARRAHLEPAVTAWVRWSAARRNMDEEATALLTEGLEGIFSRFDQAYGDREAAVTRGYLADLAVSNADVAWLASSAGRRMFALPVPEEGRPDLADPGVRRALAEEEFGGCTPPAGLTSEQFVTAAHKVIEELWRGEPEATYLASRRMADEGLSRHQIIHRLAAPAR